MLYICIHNGVDMKIETKELLTVKNYAKKIGHNRSWVYQLINSQRVDLVEIDGVKFVRVK